MEFEVSLNIAVIEVKMYQLLRLYTICSLVIDWLDLDFMFIYISYHML